jgi:hypothetical protein
MLTSAGTGDLTGGLTSGLTTVGGVVPGTAGSIITDTAGQTGGLVTAVETGNAGAIVGSTMTGVADVGGQNGMDAGVANQISNASTTATSAADGI